MRKSQGKVAFLIPQHLGGTGLKCIPQLALLVEDHKLSRNKLSPKCFEVLQKMAFLAACYANNIQLDGELPTSFNKNKLTFSHVEYIQLKSDHPCAGGIARAGFKFTKPEAELAKGENPYFYLGIPTKEEGLPNLGSEEPTFHDFMKLMSDEACIGGNVPNAAMNAVLMIEALSSIDSSLQILIATSENTILSQKLSERSERMRETLSVLLLSSTEPREGLHIPVEFLHNAEDGNRMQTIMINSESPSVERIQTTIQGIRSQLEECLLVSGDHRLGLEGINGTRLIPSTASRKTLTPESGGVILINADEFSEIMRNAGLWSKADALLPVVNPVIDTLNIEALKKTSAAFRKIAEAFLKKRPESEEVETQPQRIAQVGMTNGMMLDVFIIGNEIVFLETSAMKDFLIKKLIECANSESISLEKIDLTGRGDAAAAATILDIVDPEKLLTWWGEKHNRSISSELSEKQKSLWHMMLTSLVSRLNSKIVHHTPGSNFFESIDAEGYRNVLDLGMSIAINLVLDQEKPENTEPQTLRDDSSQMKTTIWKIPLKE